MQTDRELLVLAAKALGTKPDSFSHDGTAFFGKARWNPLTDDGDALRLAVRLQLTVANEHVSAGAAYCTRDEACFPDVDCQESGSGEVLDSDYAATRRAIVLAAAAIGEPVP